MTTRQLLLGAMLFLFTFTTSLTAAKADDEPAPAVASKTDDDSENDGQSELDAAISAKLAVEDLGDLSKVIRLCQRALDKDLSPENRQFAKKLLASALMERSQQVSAAIFGPAQPDPRWRQMRDAALVDLHKALDLDEQATMHLLIVRLEALPGGDRKRATYALDRAIEISNDDEETQFEALMIRAGTSENVDRKLADYEQAHELRPTDPVPLRARGALKLSLEKPEEALADFDLAIELDPKHAPTYEVRGMTLTLLNRLEEADKSYAAAVELAPRSAATLMQRAQVDLLTENYKQALDNAAEALKIDEDLPEALMIHAQAAMRLEQWESALKDIDHLIDQQPDLVPAQKARALALVGLQRTDEAIAQLERIVRNDPRDLETQMQLGLLHRTQKDFKKAFRIFDSALAIDPENWMLRYARADALLSIGRHKDAIEDYNIAVKLSPRNSGLLNNLAWVLATSPVDDVRDGRRAIELAKMAAEATDYQQANILSTLGAAYAEAGDLETAKQWVEKALEVTEDDDERTALEKELANYESGKPIREIQHEDETQVASPPDRAGVRR